MNTRPSSVSLFALILALPVAAKAAAPAIDWVSVPAGSFQMGTDQWEETKPVHKVSVKAFKLSKTPVTVKQYSACVAAGACAPVADCAGAPKAEEMPQTCVTWKDAEAFAKWADARLPSDAEWEYAARDAGKAKKYPWGTNHVSLQSVCAGSATKLGLCDMDTVWEWVQDWYHPTYAGAPKDGSAWDDSGWDRVYVGGGFYEKADGKVVSPCRRLAPATRRADLTFRVARS
jgi:formylglycine-generating enzyme required for sulfatase activity